jgi:hypothetical protein
VNLAISESRTALPAFATLIEPIFQYLSPKLRDTALLICNEGDSNLQRYEPARWNHFWLRFCVESRRARLRSSPNLFFALRLRFSRLRHTVTSLALNMSPTHSPNFLGDSLLPAGDNAGSSRKGFEPSGFDTWASLKARVFWKGPSTFSSAQAC